MDNKILKEKIKSNTLDDSPLILIYQDNSFVCYQYVNQICKNRKLEKLKINKLSDITNDDEFFDAESSYLYVYDIEKLEETVPADMKNIIVVCKAKNIGIKQVKLISYKFRLKIMLKQEFLEYQILKQNGCVILVNIIFID